MYNLAQYLFSFILFNKFYACFDFYYKLILINKFIEHNQVSDPYYDIKYLNLYLFLNFSNYIFIYVNDFFYLSTQ